MNPWTRVGVDEPESRVEGGEPVLCDYGLDSVVILQTVEQPEGVPVAANTFFMNRDN
jgi:hypothetical protein